MTDSFKEGWNLYSKISGIGYSTNISSKYCDSVQTSIDDFANEMNKIVNEHGNLGVGQCKGFVAEVWHSNTYNINATLHDSPNKAFTVKSTKLGSVDVSTNFDRNYSMKFLENAKKSVEAQSKTYYKNYEEYLRKPRKGAPLSLEQYLEKYGFKNDPTELLKSVYDGQYRVISKDQLENAKKILNDLIAKEKQKDGPNRILVYKNYIETLNKLTDRISSGDGIESVPLENETAEIIVELCKNDDFRAKDFNMDLSSLMTTDFILEQALKSGYTAATISLAIEIAPKIFEAINQLIKYKNIDYEQFKKIGFAAIKGESLGFVRGFVSSALTISCLSGKLGPQFMKVPSNIIAAITVLTLDTIGNSYLAIKGKISTRELFEKTEDAAIVTISGLIGGSLGTILIPHLTVLGYMIGSFAGSLVGGFVAKAKNTLIMSLCSNTGITLFGLVDQDYTIPDEMIKSLGINVIEMNIINENLNEEHYIEINENEEVVNEIHTIKLFTVRRGVIGVRKIGFQEI